MKYHKVLSIGHRCTSQVAIKYASKLLRLDCYGETSPFSWINNLNIKNLINVLETDFVLTGKEMKIKKRILFVFLEEDVVKCYQNT